MVTAQQLTMIRRRRHPIGRFLTTRVPEVARHLRKAHRLH